MILASTGSVIVGVAGAVLVLLGLVQWRCGDMMWAWHEWRMRGQGLTNLQRTAEWDTRQRFGAGWVLLIGIVLVVVAMSGAFDKHPSHAGSVFQTPDPTDRLQFDDGTEMTWGEYQRRLENGGLQPRPDGK